MQSHSQSQLHTSLYESHVGSSLCCTLVTRLYAVLYTGYSFSESSSLHCKQRSVSTTRLNLGKRVFSVAAPSICNELQTTLKSLARLSSVRKNLKTYRPHFRFLMTTFARTFFLIIVHDSGSMCFWAKPFIG